MQHIIQIQSCKTQNSTLLTERVSVPAFIFAGMYNIRKIFMNYIEIDIFSNCALFPENYGGRIKVRC